MERIPELILLPLSKSEAILILDALSDHHLHLKERGAPDLQTEMYDHLMSKIVELLKEGSTRAPETIR